MISKLRLKLNRTQRIRSKSQFARVFDSRQSSADSQLVLYMCKNDLGFNRVGVCVGKKLGNAVTRNRYKRTMRQAFRILQHDLPISYDYVLIPRVTKEPLAEKYEKSLAKIANKLAKKLERKNKGL